MDFLKIKSLTWIFLALDQYVKSCVLFLLILQKIQIWFDLPEIMFTIFLLIFQTCHIFHEYEHFLIVIASAVNHIQWFGLIESKLRYFISSVEKVLNFIFLRLILSGPSMKHWRVKIDPIFLIWVYSKVTTSSGMMDLFWPFHGYKTNMP